MRPSPPTARGCPPMSGDFDFSDLPVRRVVHRPPATQYPPTNSLGITSLILGAVSLPFMCIPGLNVVAMALAGVGLLLGGVGLVVSISRQGYGIGYPVGGVTVS